MKHEYFIKRKPHTASLVWLMLILPVGTFATEPVKSTRVLQEEGLKKTAVENPQDTLKACLYRIPSNLNLEQAKLAEENCQKNVVERVKTSLTH